MFTGTHTLFLLLWVLNQYSHERRGDMRVGRRLNPQGAPSQVAPRRILVKLGAKYREGRSQISECFCCPDVPGKLGRQPVGRSTHYNFRSLFPQFVADSSH